MKKEEIEERMRILRKVYEEWVIHAQEENERKKVCRQAKAAIDWVESKLKEAP